MAIISMAEQARPRLIGQMAFLRAQLMAKLSVVVMMESPNSFASGSSSMRANSSGGWLSWNLTSSTPVLSHGWPRWNAPFGEPHAGASLYRSGKEAFFLAQGPGQL